MVVIDSSLNQYDPSNHTSMAAPLVTGIAALLVD
ncbi:MAG: S8 family serine peptidase [Bacteroidetes bacterium]|nr:S8 family serine peptidase [Bacteroidota bacterium]